MKLSTNGMVGSITVHGLLIALLLLGGLTFPDPPPEEEGILVNFGTDDSGMGLIEPEGDESNAGVPEPVSRETDDQVPNESLPPEEPVSETTTDHTQDIEETPVKEDPKPTAEEIRRKREAEERRQRELEEQRRREEERRKQQEQANRINKLGENTFGRQGVGEEEGSQGVSPGEGTNQGTETGTPGAPNYGEGAGLGDGISYGLGSRKAAGDLTKPSLDNCQVTSRIVITVEIQVDRSGNVVAANVSNATFADDCIWNQVIKAARDTKFKRDPDASFKQKGWIRYTIEP